MTTQHNPAEVARLIAEAREDDARMTPGPWETGEDPGESAATLRARPCIRGHEPGEWVDVIVPFGRAYSDAAGIARTRNNLRAMADQLEAAQVEIERLSTNPPTEKRGHRDRGASTYLVAMLEAQNQRDRLQSELEAARAEIERWKGFEQQEERYANDLLEERDKLQAELEAARRELASVREVADPDNETPELSLRDRVMHIGEQAALLVSVNRRCDKLRAELETARQEVERLRHELDEAGQEIEAMMPWIEGAGVPANRAAHVVERIQKLLTATAPPAQLP